MQPGEQRGVTRRGGGGGGSGGGGGTIPGLYPSSPGNSGVIEPSGWNRTVFDSDDVDFHLEDGKGLEKTEAVLPELKRKLWNVWSAIRAKGSLGVLKSLIILAVLLIALGFAIQVFGQKSERARAMSLEDLKALANEESRVEGVGEVRTAEWPIHAGVWPHGPVARSGREPRFFFAALLYNSEEVSLNWVGELLRVIEWLGRDRCFVSIVENGSVDATKPILKALEDVLTARGIDHSIVMEGWVRSIRDSRIIWLAKLRNRALYPLTRDHCCGAEQWQPLVEGQSNWNTGLRDGSSLDDVDDIRIVYLNDIWYHAEDLVELIQTWDGEWDMMCAMDFYHGFYDRWVARDIHGELFSPYYPYVREPEGQAGVRSGSPFPVFSCWNGVTIMSADPFLHHGLEFRWGEDGECPRVSECTLICSDMHEAGYGRIMINPNVKVTYDAGAYWNHRWYWPILRPFLGALHWLSPSESVSPELEPSRRRAIPGQIEWCTPEGEDADYRPIVDTKITHSLDSHEECTSPPPHVNSRIVTEQWWEEEGDDEGKDASNK